MLLQEKNNTQRRSSRFLVSIVPEALPKALADPSDGGGGGSEPWGGGGCGGAAAAAAAVVDKGGLSGGAGLGCTVYPIWQPRCGFLNNVSKGTRCLGGVGADSGAASMSRALSEAPRAHRHCTSRAPRP